MEFRRVLFRSAAPPQTRVPRKDRVRNWRPEEPTGEPLASGTSQRSPPPPEKSECIGCPEPTFPTRVMNRNHQFRIDCAKVKLFHFEARRRHRGPPPESRRGAALVESTKMRAT